MRSAILDNLSRVVSCISEPVLESGMFLRVMRVASRIAHEEVDGARQIAATKEFECYCRRRATLRRR